MDSVAISRGLVLGRVPNTVVGCGTARIGAKWRRGVESDCHPGLPFGETFQPIAGTTQ
jgi:hypothetical protein